MQGISAEADDLSHQIDYLCAIGTYGDLGTSFTFLPPWPQEGMKRATKKWTKKCLTDAVGLLNARQCSSSFVCCLTNMQAILDSKAHSNL